MHITSFKMKSSKAVFSTVSIRSHTIGELIDKLPYSADTVYRAVDELEKEGLLDKTKKGKGVLVTVSNGYKAQKMREIHIKALSYGIDPEVLLRDSTVQVWLSLDRPKKVDEIKQEVELSEKWIRNVLNFLEKHDLVRFEKKRPIIAEINEEHRLNELLRSYYSSTKEDEDVYQPGRSSFQKEIKTPEKIEKALYEKIDSGLTVKDTDYLVKGKKFNILESVPEELSIEEVFLREITTVEGVEDFCIRIVKSDKMDYDRLLELSKEEGMVNIVGCYLDIINDIAQLVAPGVLRRFKQYISDEEKTFLKEEKEYGKDGWEKEYEEKWNLDIYLDLGAIRHGVRGL